jgi:capsular polysaccharide transport system ATP-binding protein
MIVFENVHKSFACRPAPTVIADDISLRIPACRSVALLGRNGAGKTSLLRMLAGTLRPDHGRIRVDGRVSWPVGFAGGFHPDHTGSENIQFVARAYGVDAPALLRFVSDFARIDSHLDRPVRTYSHGMRARVAFGLSMGLPFEIYLVDEVTAVGDAAFREASDELLTARLQDAGALVVSHSLRQLARLCQSGLVLDQGQLTWHEDVMDAITRYRALMGNTA